MFTMKEYGKYLVLSILAKTIIFTPTLAGAAFPNLARMNVQISQTSSASNNAANEAEIKKVLLAAAQKQNWQPEIVYVDQMFAS